VGEASGHPFKVAADARVVIFKVLTDRQVGEAIYVNHALRPFMGGAAVPVDVSLALAEALRVTGAVEDLVDVGDSAAGAVEVHKKSPWLT